MSTGADMGAGGAGDGSARVKSDSRCLARVAGTSPSRTGSRRHFMAPAPHPSCPGGAGGTVANFEHPVRHQASSSSARKVVRATTCPRVNGITRLYEIESHERF